MYAIIKEHQDGTVTVPVVADSYGLALSRAEGLRDEELAQRTLQGEAFDWEPKNRPESGWFGIESVGDETVEWYIHQVEEVLD